MIYKQLDGTYLSPGLSFSFFLFANLTLSLARSLFQTTNTENAHKKHLFDNDVESSFNCSARNKEPPDFYQVTRGQAIYHYYHFCISGILCKTEGADVERVGRHSLIPVKYLWGWQENPGSFQSQTLGWKTTCSSKYFWKCRPSTGHLNALARWRFKKKNKYEFFSPSCRYFFSLLFLFFPFQASLWDAEWMTAVTSCHDCNAQDCTAPKVYARFL